MKPLIFRTLSCMLACSVLCIGKSYGQCPGGQPYSTENHDTIVVSSSGNTTFVLPQFDPSTGTLYSVKASADVYLTYSYRLTNNTSSDLDYSMTVKRKDILRASSPGNPNFDLFPSATVPTIFDYVVADNTGLPPGVSDSTAQIYTPRHINENTYTVPYMGSGNLTLTYQATTSVALDVTTDIAFAQTGVRDSLVLKVSYIYCPSAALPSTFINLTAQAQSSNILLAWTSQEILTGGSFELLKSVDGRTYTSINKQAVNGNNLAGYNYLYKPTAQDPTKAFFRIKQTDQNGNITYSKVITVVFPTGNNSGSINEQAERNLVVYPTIPTGNFINVFIPSGTNSDEWTISIISLAGRVMQQSKFSKTNLAKVNFTNPLTPGMYIVDAYNTRTQEHFKDKIVVQ